MNHHKGLGTALILWYDLRNLAEDGDKWLELVNAVMNLRVP